MTATVPAVVARRWPRRAAYAGVAGLAVLLPTSTAGASWLLANQVLNVTAGRQYPLRVKDVSDGRVTLTRTVDTSRPFPLSFVWPDGHARLGPIVRDDKSTVTREITVDRGALRAGARGYSSGYVYEGTPSLSYRDVTVSGPLGPLPAWLIPGTSATWIIAVHGRGAPRGEALRILPTLAASGHPTLVVTYRNDDGAPASPDGRYHLGATEWEDVLAAVEYARSHGAMSVVLYGWSMGGTILLTMLRRWSHDGFVRGLIMDCPVIDWASTLRMNARQLGIPSAWTWTALRLIERQARLRMRDLDLRGFVSSLDVPTLLFVDHDDPTVASGPTLEFGRARPELIRTVETHGAGHCRVWNVDPSRYEGEVRGFLSGLRDTEFV